MRGLLKVLSWLFIIAGLIVVITLVSFLPTETAEPVMQPVELKMQQRTVGGETPDYWDSVQSYLTGLLKGDLGESEHDEPIAELMLTYAPRSLAVLFGAFVLALPIGIALGVFFAMRKGKFWDKVKSFFTYASLSFPDFFVVFFMQWLAIKVWKTGWEVIPAAGYRDPQHMILPILTLSMLPMLYLVRLTWHSVDEVIEREPYIVTARSKGIERLLIYIRHALGNVWVRLLDYIPQLFVLMVSNLLIIEFLFYYPGSVFQLFYRLSDQAQQQPGAPQSGMLWDPPLIASTAIMFALCFLAIYGISRGLRLWIDPRLRGGLK